MLRKVGVVALGAALMAGLLVGGMALADSHETIHACVQNNNGNVRIVEAGAECPDNWSEASWNQTGPAGVDGADGTDGTDGVLGFYRVNDSSRLSGDPPQPGGHDVHRIEISCDSGDIVTGGGHRTTTTGHVYIAISEPMSDLGGWQVTAINNLPLGAEESAHGYAVCADVTP